MRVPDGGSEKGKTAGGGGTGGDTIRDLGPTRTLTETSDTYRGMGDSAAVHIKWDGLRGIGMA